MASNAHLNRAHMYAQLSLIKLSAASLKDETTLSPACTCTVAELLRAKFGIKTAATIASLRNVATLRKVVASA